VFVMRCNLCGAEMQLLRVGQDDAMRAAGYEHQTFQCTGCERTGRRLAFTGSEASWPAAYRWALGVIAPHPPDTA
jgi:transposase-like protein